MELIRLETETADIWIACGEGGSEYDYAYGGMRKTHCLDSDEQVEGVLRQLAKYESHLKNSLIDRAVADGALQKLEDRLPEGFVGSRVEGGRCLFRPKTEHLGNIFGEPQHPEFVSKIRGVLRAIGEELNRRGGRVKLTPDFGKFAMASDLLYEFTEHSLGIRCSEGGCGGKSSYSATGINGALEYFGFRDYLRDGKITLIGSDGALGSDVFAFLRYHAPFDFRVCDLQYTEDRLAEQDGFAFGYTTMPGKFGRYTDDCLKRGDLIVATTVGRELENCNLDVIPEGTVLLLGHNLCVPTGTPGRDLLRQCKQRGLTVIPGQILTFGGALTSRIEWFWRQSRKGVPFDKPLAHSAVKEAVQFLLRKVMESSEETPYEAMLSYAGIDIR